MSMGLLSRCKCSSPQGVFEQVQQREGWTGEDEDRVWAAKPHTSVCVLCYQKIWTSNNRNRLKPALKCCFPDPVLLSSSAMGLLIRPLVSFCLCRGGASSLSLPFSSGAFRLASSLLFNLCSQFFSQTVSYIYLITNLCPSSVSLQNVSYFFCLLPALLPFPLFKCFPSRPVSTSVLSSKSFMILSLLLRLLSGHLPCLSTPLFTPGGGRCYD